MVKIYLYDSEQSSENIIIPGQYSSGIDFYNNKEGKTVFIETWINTTNTIDPTNNFQSYIDTSTVQIKNLCKLNGTYISTYVYNDNFINDQPNTMKDELKSFLKKQFTNLQNGDTDNVTPINSMF